MPDEAFNQTPQPQAEQVPTEQTKAPEAAPMPAQPNATPANQAAPATMSTSGLAVAGLVLGIVGFLLSFIPLMNMGSIIMGILGIVLAAAGLVGINKGRAQGKGIAIAGLVLGILALVVVFVMYGSIGAAADKAAKESNTATTENTVAVSNDSSAAADSSAAPAAEAASKQADDGKSSSGDSSAADATAKEEAATQESSAAAKEEAAAEDAKYVVSIDDAYLTQDYSGAEAVVVTYSWTNNSDETTNFMTTFSGKVFQNSVEQENAIVMDIDSSAYMADVKPGGTAQVQMAYKVADHSDITVEVHPWISFNKDEVLAERTFSLE